MNLELERDNTRSGTDTAEPLGGKRGEQQTLTCQSIPNPLMAETRREQTADGSWAQGTSLSTDVKVRSLLQHKQQMGMRGIRPGALMVCQDSPW